jgi:hypothetical protein
MANQKKVIGEISVDLPSKLVLSPPCTWLYYLPVIDIVVAIQCSTVQYEQ